MMIQDFSLLLRTKSAEVFQSCRYQNVLVVITHIKGYTDDRSRAVLN
jgi:hypothetical protein